MLYVLKEVRLHPQFPVSLGLLKATTVHCVAHQPLGVVLVVLAFLVATFFIHPFSLAVGLTDETSLDALSVVLAFFGAALCIIELPGPLAYKLQRKCFSQVQ